MTGLFLTVEGCEGAGKTTAVNFIKRWMVRRPIDFVETREPGGTQVAEKIRELLLAEHQESIASMTEMLLMFAARSQNLHCNIQPALAKGKVVLCDRFTDATYAYQGGGRGLSVESVKVLESLVQGACRPDVTILLDIPPALGLARAKGRGGELDRIERERIDFFERIRAAYLERARLLPEQFEVIDASRELDFVESELESILEKWLISQ